MSEVNELLSFLEKSPTCFHAIENIKTLLKEHGFTQLKEGKVWDVQKGGKYYVTRNGSSVIAFDIGETLDDYHFQLTASHSDSPTFKLKDKPELKSKDYTQLNVEPYGGAINFTWFDRPLTIAGRVLVKEGNKLTARLVYIDKNLLIIPNVAPHMFRDINDGRKFNTQIDLIPLMGSGELDTREILAKELNCEKEDIISFDLSLATREKPCVWGYKEEFIGAQHLDDLQCAFTSLKGFVEGHNEHAVNVYCCFDNEEVGSLTKQGARSTFLSDTLMRLTEKLGFTNEEYHCAVAKSFLVSCDNAHAKHPNHPEIADAENYPLMNKGPVIKFNAAQHYTSDGVSASIFKSICTKAGVPFQVFANRSDVRGGGTLGNIVNEHVSMNMVDIGLPQLAMHSSYETAGVLDNLYTIKALKMFYDTNIVIDESESFEF